MRNGRRRWKLPDGLLLSIEDRPAANDRQAVERALIEFNAHFLPDAKVRHLALLIRNERREILAGLDSAMYAGWLFVDNLWVHGDLRKRGIGRELLRKAEQHAILSGCHSAWLDTFSFPGTAILSRPRL